jgi:hypothetical protein
MIVCSTGLAVDLLGPYYLGCYTVSMMLLVFAVASLDVLGVDSEELEILPLVVEVLFKTL